LHRLDPTRLEEAFAVVSEGIGAGAYPGAVAAVGGPDGLEAMRAFGHSAVEPEPIPMQTDTIFDLASLTKVVATTPAVLRLIEDGAIALEQPVHELLPAFRDRRVTICHLLTHTSGLPAWKGLYLEHRGWEDYIKGICQVAPEREPGVAVTYSDLGFLLLGAVVMRVTGQSLPDLCRTAVFEPLGMTETGWLPTAPRERIAATERTNSTEISMTEGQADGFPWRTSLMWGEAHDGNAWYGLGGVASHAGLFGTAADLARCCTAWLNGGGPILKPSTVALATANWTPGMAEQRGLGWQKPPAPSAGDRLTPAAYGHTGFTGTSIWIDPGQSFFAILLTNRVHPYAREGLTPVRSAFMDAVVNSLAREPGAIGC